MPRYRRPPLGLEDIWQSGPPVRVRDLMAVTGWSRPTILASVECGDLIPVRRMMQPFAQYFFERSAVREWLLQSGFVAGESAETAVKYSANDRKTVRSL